MNMNDPRVPLIITYAAACREANSSQFMRRIPVLSVRDLSNIDLSGANLREIRLTEKVINLSGANFSECNLSGAVFDEADISGVNFSGANLNGATLRFTIARGTNFSRAKLHMAKITTADIREANFTNADCTEAVLNMSISVGADFTGAILRGARLEGANVANSNITEKQFRQVYKNETTYPDAKVDKVLFLVPPSDEMKTRVVAELGRDGIIRVRKAKFKY